MGTDWGRMAEFFRVRVTMSTALIVAIVSLVACQSPTAANNASATASATGRQESHLASGPSRDLSRDEAAGGHILRKHVRQTDAELRERLERERHITGASTYTDRPTAEHAVGAAIAQSQGRIERWLGRPGGHPNLVLDYDSPEPIGSGLS